jgi:hypothetical protein
MKIRDSGTQEDSGFRPSTEQAAQLLVPTELPILKALNNPFSTSPPPHASTPNLTHFHRFNFVNFDL